MEMPAFLLFPVLVLSGPAEKTPFIWLLLILWTWHYFYRTLIFPFKLRTRGKKIPVLIVVMALIFNGINGFLNGYFLGFMHTQELSLNSFHVIFGLLLFFSGMVVNRRSDFLLINLRTNGQGYQIPKGFMFKYISCPNHFGEILEWTGFAVIAWNLPALSFALWTAFNLIPRSIDHHQWYKQRFDEYPEERRAIIPFLL